MNHGLRTTTLALVACLLIPAAASAQVAGPDAMGNVFAPIPLDWVDLETIGVDTGITTDDAEVEVELPFTFTWYGVGYDWVTVADNGGIAFTDGTGPSNVSFGNTAFPDDSDSIDIASYHDDMNVAVGGVIYTYDDVANGRFIVSWQNHARWFGNAAEDVSHQIHLYDDGGVEIHIVDATSGAASSNGTSATIGAQDLAGDTNDDGNFINISHNTFVDDGSAWAFELGDADFDGFITTDLGGDDCDDADPDVFPGNPEICADGIDQDCNGFDSLSDLDGDGDTNFECGGDDCDDTDATISSLIDVDGDGSSACDDCDDADAANFPGNVEICDDADNDCDGVGDDLGDGDGDGFTVCDLDCDDGDADVFPGNPEVACDGLDNDCDAATADDADGDADGFGCSSDCDDADATIFPGADELCDDVDSDCDGNADAFDLDVVTTVTGTWTETTVDGQGVDSANPDTISVATLASGLADTIVDVMVTLNITHTFTGDLDITLTSPAGTVVELTTDNGSSGDNFYGTVFWDDAPTAITSISSGGAPHTGLYSPEGSLADFSGEAVDGDWTLTVTDDAGGDTGTLDDWTLAIEVGTVTDDDIDLDGALASCGDCDDNEPTVFPGAEDICGDTIDQDCSGADEDADFDADGFTDEACGGDDCDDTDATINPGAVELCDTVDSDCDGLDDGLDLDIGATPITPVNATSTPAATFDNTADITDTIDLTGTAGAVTDVNVTVDITHPFDDDVEVYLISPAGTTVELFTDIGGSGDDFTATVLDDEATDAIVDFDDSASAPFTGSFQPEGLLSDFDGEAIDGVWTLQVGDDASGDDGVLNSWILDIEGGVLDDADMDGYVDSCGDCDPADGDTYPGAPEICGDGIDQDCDTLDVTVDLDGDTYNDEACGGDDCDDADPAINPMGVEVCEDGADNDCDGTADNVDVDGDGSVDALCGGDDCDDTNAAINPLADELCDTIDSDCDGLDDSMDLDINVTTAIFQDFEADDGGWVVSGDANWEYGAPTSGPGAAFSGSNVWATVLAGDFANSADSNLDLVGVALPAGAPAIQLMYWSDNDGGGSDYTKVQIDDGGGFVDVVGNVPDVDEWTQATIDLSAWAGMTVTIRMLHHSTSVVPNPGSYFDDFAIITLDDADLDGFVASCGDCDDAEENVFPGALEICGDGLDQDCDGADDAEDGDGDTFIAEDCGGDDCDDVNATVFPGAVELCNDFVDNDCDELTEDIFDGDGDGVTCEIDCDDSEPLAFQGFVELCNDGVDNDCDPATADLGDFDGDGVSCELDCDDTNPIIFPGAPELLCTGLDEDCDTMVDPDVDDGDGDTFACDVDCDDDDPAVNPGALEIPCNGQDDNCDGESDTDNGADNDVDMDGVTCDQDCDDNDPLRFPGNPEICDDAIDNDCDPATVDVFDLDLDGFDCLADCDDGDPLTFPGAPEICGDGLDQDCDTEIDELAAGPYDLVDDDSVQIGICSFDFDFCGVPMNEVYVQDNGRLTFGFDDTTSTPSIVDFVAQTPEIAALWTDLDPGAAGTVEVTEVDGVGLTVEFTGVQQFGLVGFACDDTDTVEVDLSEAMQPIGTGTEGALLEAFSDLGSPNDLQDMSIELCLTAGEDVDGDGVTDACGDCDDGDATVYTGAMEVCGDGLDNDCDGTVDNLDADLDGYIDAACGGLDCDDADAAINPDAAEICNGVDDDCDGAPEDDELDGDGDGYFPCLDDCDDGDADVSPDAVEVCDLVDNNCDGDVDEGFESDLDGDGFIAEACGGDDCDDEHSGAFPGGEEICDLADNDCDGTVDNVDADGDTYIDDACSGDDCDDGDAAINPGAEEVPYDGIDNDCLDGDVEDADGDGVPAIDAGGTDCDDTDVTVYPSAVEVCDDGIDNDCDDLSDGDDEECGACADCNSSYAGAGAQGGLFALLLVAVAGLRRRR